MIQWEFTYIQAGTNVMGQVKDMANKLGSLGWEPVGITGADKTVGVNAIIVTFKRQVVPPPPANTDQQETYQDPTGRHAFRRWNGRVWTAEAAGADRKLVVDPPTMLNDPDFA